MKRTSAAWVCVITLAATSALAQSAASGRRSAPVLPETPFRYDDGDLPQHFTEGGGPESVASSDNTPVDNPTTDTGATLGRVLFYDTRLSAN
ncbi:MAG TPA: hypothetical protein EYQ83_02700, partial [Acidobacteria bacterium]|nr:hypothetical protein [Acidobacteriota bacterium]